MTPEGEPLGLENVQHATGEQWRTITNTFRKNEAAGPKQKQWSVLDMFSGENKVWC